MNNFSKTNNQNFYKSTEWMMLKGGIWGALAGIGMWMSSMFPFPFNIPAVYLLQPFVLFSVNIFDSNPFSISGPEWSFSFHITFWGVLLLVFIGFILGLFFSAIKNNYGKYIRRILFVIVFLGGLMGILYNAKSFNSSILCSLLANNGASQECFAKVAVKKLDASLCEKADESNTGSSYTIAGSTERMPSPGINFNNCYKEIAKKTSNLSLCSNIRGPNEYDDMYYCYKGALGGKIDFTICDAISNIENKNMCINQIALNSKDPTMCEKLDWVSRSTCLYQMACQNNDKDICYSIYERKGQYTCLEKMADNAKDICFAKEKLGQLNEYFNMASCLENNKYVRFNGCQGGSLSNLKIE